MGKLAEWCAEQPSWAVDAMQRAAVTTELTDENVNALVNRVALAHGLSVEGSHQCQAFDESAVVSLANSPDDIILEAVGPLHGLDRLAPNQKLKFAVDGLTVIFGENGSGKSGYTRALRQLCSARRDPDLQGDVFASGPEPEKKIEYQYSQADGDSISAVWSEGDPKPNELSGISLLDSDNLRVYVENRNEILYLPAEVACVGRLADLYQAAAAHYRTWINANEARYQQAFGAHYQQGTTAAMLSSRLKLTTPEKELPSEVEIRSAGEWTPELESELQGLSEQLAQGPAALAARFDRIAAACSSAVEELSRIAPPLADAVCDRDAALIEVRESKKQIAETLRAEQIGSQPIAATGSDTWKTLYQVAREFAAEADLRSASEPFVVGDHCPLCQQVLSESAAERLAAFDAFVEGRAAQELDAAEAEIRDRLEMLRSLTFKDGDALSALLGETASFDPAATLLVQQTVEYNSELKTRRDARVAQLEASQIVPLVTLPKSPVEDLKGLASKLSEKATRLRAKDEETSQANIRLAELNARKQFSSQVEEAVERRNGLFITHRYRSCEGDLNTGPLSRLISNLRKELLSPDLEARIQAEIARLALTHVPFKFADASERGASYFEMRLATDKKAKKARILSEGEQRALSLACFLAESHVAGKRSGIILDDPVTSLDHGRVRRVSRRLVEEAAKGRQIIVFTHNLVFYHELMLASVDRAEPVPVLPCLIQQGDEGEFGVVSVGDEPWVARKVRERENSLKAMIDEIPDNLAISSQDYRRRCTGFYAALRETWERAVEEIALNDVVRRFGSDVGTLRLAGVEVSDEDFILVYHAMKRASEFSGHDQAAGRQIDMPTKEQMMADWHELVGFRTTRAKANRARESHRKELASKPPQASVR